MSDTLEFQHHHLTIPTRTPEDHIIHGVKKLTTSINTSPEIECDNQLASIRALRQAFHRWLRPMEQQSPYPPPKLHHQPSSTQWRNPSLLRRTQWRQKSANPPPRVVSNRRPAELLTPTSAPIVVKWVDDEEEPIAMCTRLQRQMTPGPTEIQEEPISRRTRSQTQIQPNIVTPARAAACRYPAAIFQYLDLPVLDK